MARTAIPNSASAPSTMKKIPMADLRDMFFNSLSWSRRNSNPCHGFSGGAPASHHPHLDRVHDLFAHHDRADDDYGVAFAQPALSHHFLECGLNCVFGVDEIEGNDKGCDRPA